MDPIVLLHNGGVRCGPATAETAPICVLRGAPCPGMGMADLVYPKEYTFNFNFISASGVTSQSMRFTR